MDGPPVRYVTTKDGFDIAYTVCGAGRPFVFLPWPYSHRGLWWRTAFGRPLAEALAKRFRLVQYDSRGQGMSGRGLPEHHSMDDYLLDLEAVVEQAGLDRFVLYGGPMFGHVAIRYAVAHPERVEALVLGDVGAGLAWGGPGLEELARRDWSLFLHVFASSFSLNGAPLEFAYWSESLNQDDCLMMLKLGSKSDVVDLLPALSMPVVIINTRRFAQDEPAGWLATEGQAMAALIPNARLILYDGFAGYWYSAGPEPPPAVPIIEQFLDELLPPWPTEPEGSGAERLGVLSERQRQVLRLVAAGKTNREIAGELFLSERTVQRHISDIYVKINARNRAEATAAALGIPR